MLEARRITTMLNTGPSLYSVALSLAQSHSLSLSLSPSLSRSVSNLLLTIDLPSRSLSLSLLVGCSGGSTICLLIMNRHTHTSNKIETRVKRGLTRACRGMYYTLFPLKTKEVQHFTHMAAGCKATKQCRRHERKGQCRICITAKGPGANASHAITWLCWPWRADTLLCCRHA